MRNQAWLNHMVSLFGERTEILRNSLDSAAADPSGKPVDMEERFGSLALDIIGKAVFNYEFGSVDEESPVVSAAIATLRESEHRAMTPAPYWKLPGAGAKGFPVIVPRQAAFQKNMALLNDELNGAIAKALEDRDPADEEDLQNRDYSKMSNPSLLRFMVDMRGEETSSTQLRDDLMTMLIAGHETTASALTWALFEMRQNQELMDKVRAEIDSVIGDRAPTVDDLEKLELTRLCVAESLRMYPEPPLLIRRSLNEVQLPADSTGVAVKLLRASDIMINVYSLHRSPLYWEQPDVFDPERFLRPYKNDADPNWAGFDPEAWRGKVWYPNEVAADFAYLPFGAGQRKCVGDQFALLEATVALAMVLQRYDFDFAAPTATPADVGTNTGATIHTRNGLWMAVKRRQA